MEKKAKIGILVGLLLITSFFLAGAFTPNDNIKLKEYYNISGTNWIFGGEDSTSGDIHIKGNILNVTNISADNFLGNLSGDVNASDVQNEYWVDESGDTMTGNLNLDNNRLDNTSIIHFYDSVGDGNQWYISENPDGQGDLAISYEGDDYIEFDKDGGITAKDNIKTKSNRIIWGDGSYIEEDGSSNLVLNPEGKVSLSSGNLDVDGNVSADWFKGLLDWSNLTNKQPSDFNYDILLKEDNITDFGNYIPYSEEGNLDVDNSDKLDGEDGSYYLDNTDDQTLSVDSSNVDDEISIENGNTITIDDDYEANTDASTKCSGTDTYLSGDDTCETDSDTTYSAGDYLTLSGTTFNVQNQELVDDSTINASQVDNFNIKGTNDYSYANEINMSDESITYVDGRSLYVPYTGATDNLDLGSNNITAETLQTPSQYVEGWTNDAPDSQSCSNTESCGSLFDEDDDTYVKINWDNTGDVTLTFTEEKTIKDFKIKQIEQETGADITIYYKEDGSWVEHQSFSSSDLDTTGSTGWKDLECSEEHTSKEWKFEIEVSLQEAYFSELQYEDLTGVDSTGQIKWDGTDFVVDNGNSDILKVDSNGRIEGLVPYTGAEENLDMGSYDITTKGLGTFGTTIGSRGEHSFAIGKDVEASGDYSFASGDGTNASGYRSTAMGFATTASDDTSTAMGDTTTASGFHSTAMGDFTTASGYRSTAMGFATTASDDYSTVMGRSTTASGDTSTAMGDFTTASGSQATAMGRDIEVSGTNSFGIGLDSGDWNISQDNTMSVMGGDVGIGTVSPSTALEVDGNITANDFITQSKVPDVSKGKGKGLDKIKNIKDWKDKDGNINYKNHYAHTKMEKENTSKIIDYEEVEECHEEDGEEVCETVEKPIYDTYEVDGLSMETRIAEMEKMIYELKEQNECLATKQDSKEEECLE